MKHRIRLRGINGDVEGKIWESETQLRAGRLASLEMVLDDSSVSRRHAEVRSGDVGWRLRDLGSTNGTFLNGVRLQPNAEKEVKPRDVIQFGKVAVSVELVDDHVPPPAPPPPPPTPAPSPPASAPEVDNANLQIEATTRSNWEDAVKNLVYDRNQSPRPGEQLLALLRANHHLMHIDSEDELLHSILHDAVAVLDAQRGAIVLADGTEWRP